MLRRFGGPTIDKPTTRLRRKVPGHSTAAGPRPAAVGAASAAVGASGLSLGPVLSENPVTPRVRAKRIYFEGHKIAVSEGHHAEAREALMKARLEEAEWDADAWQRRFKQVLQPYREGIEHGGNKRSHREVHGDAEEHASGGEAKFRKRGASAAVGAHAAPAVGAQAEAAVGAHASWP